MPLPPSERTKPDESASLALVTVTPKEGGKKYWTLKDATVRQALAILFFALFAATVVMSFVHLGTSDWKNTQQWLQTILPAETALLGSATGFYFGTKKKGD